MSKDGIATTLFALMFLGIVLGIPGFAMMSDQKGWVGTLQTIARWSFFGGIMLAIAVGVIRFLKGAGPSELSAEETELASNDLLRKFQAVQSKYRNAEIDASEYRREAAQLISYPPDGVQKVIVQIRESVENDIAQLSLELEHS